MKRPALIRAGLFLAAVLVIELPLSGSISAQASGVSDWPQVQHGPAHTGLNADETTLTASSISTVHEAWTAGLPPTSAEPVISGGNVYVAGDTVTSYTTAGVLRWSRPIPTGYYVATSAAVDSGSVLIVAQPIDGTTSKFYSLNASTGTIKWSRSLLGISGDSPTVSDGLAYLVDSANGASHLSAFAISGGTLRWRIALSGGSSEPSFSTPTVAGGRVFVNNGGAFLSAFDAVTGSALWTRSLSLAGVDQDSATVPVVWGSNVYVGTSDHVVKKIATAKGTVLWSSSGLGGRLTALSADGNAGVLVANVQPPDPYGATMIRELDMANGSLKWQDLIPNADNPTTIANGVLYVSMTVTMDSGDYPAVGFYYESTGYQVRPPVMLPTGSYDPPRGPSIADGRLYTVKGGYLPTLSCLTP